MRRDNASLDSGLHEREKSVSQLRTRVAVLEQEIKDKEQVCGWGGGGGVAMVMYMFVVCVKRIMCIVTIQLNRRCVHVVLYVVYM